jgi:hypothetical protein
VVFNRSAAAFIQSKKSHYFGLIALIQQSPFDLITNWSHLSKSRVYELYCITDSNELNIPNMDQLMLVTLKKVINKFSTDMCWFLFCIPLSALPFMLLTEKHI